MIFEVQNYIENISKSECPWASALVEYISDNFPNAQESFKNKRPTYETDDSCVSFLCQQNHFSFYSADNNSLQVIKNILPNSKLKRNNISIDYDEEYALHALKVGVNYAFNPKKVMYTNILEAKFLDRPNRFIANIEIDGQKHICHVKNTGRCKELLVEGAKIYVKKHNNPARKTDYSLISVIKGDVLINMDSQVPNKAVHKWILQGDLFDDIEYIKPEYKYHNSRIDFFIKTKNKKILLEVKGVTLEEDGIAMFPDAPTKRGIKHIEELIHAKQEEYECYIVFVIQMNTAKYFTPNNRTHPEFKAALIDAREAGVNILAYDCIVATDSIAIDTPCMVVL